MHRRSISVYVETLREEIRLIENQELFYRSGRTHTREQMAAHVLRGIRLMEIQTTLQKLRTTVRQECEI
jgi:hypothetical protein